MVGSENQSPQTVAEARELHRLGKLADAETACQILLDGEHVPIAEVQALLGVILIQSDRREDGQSLIALQTIALEPVVAGSRFRL